MLRPGHARNRSSAGTRVQLFVARGAGKEGHLLCAVWLMTDEILREMSPVFDSMYARRGRPSIPPEKLLRAQLWQMLYSVRSERLLMEEIDYSMLFRWFVGLNLDEEVWDASSFTKNRDRLLEADVAKEFLMRVVEQARSAGLTSDEHFTVDGTLLEAWASLKSFQPRDGKKNMPPGDPPQSRWWIFTASGARTRPDASRTDADAKLARKGPGKEAKLSYSGNLLVENRHGLIVNAELLEANGRAERDAALLMLEQVPGTKRVTAGADKGYDTAEFVAECRHLGVTPHVARNTGRRGGSALDARTVRHPGYAVSQRRRKRIEECFGWLKDIALLRKLRHRGLPKVGWVFTFAAAAYNLVRMRNLLKLTPQTTWSGPK